MDGFFKITEWENYIIMTKVLYVEYLFMVRKRFLYKLMSCKECLLFWIVLILTFPYTENIAVVYILSYLSYQIFSFLIKKFSI